MLSLLCLSDCSLHADPARLGAHCANPGPGAQQHAVCVSWIGTDGLQQGDLARFQRAQSEATALSLPALGTGELPLSGWPSPCCPAQEQVSLQSFLGSRAGLKETCCGVVYAPPSARLEPGPRQEAAPGPVVCGGLHSRACPAVEAPGSQGSLPGPSTPSPASAGPGMLTGFHQHILPVGHESGSTVLEGRTRPQLSSFPNPGHTLCHSSSQNQAAL